MNSEIPSFLTDQWPWISIVVTILVLLRKQIKEWMETILDFQRHKLEVKRAKLDLQIQADQITKSKIEGIEQFYRDKIEELTKSHHTQINELVEYLNFLQPFLDKECPSFNQWKHANTTN